MLRWCVPYLLAALLLFPDPAAAQPTNQFILEIGQSHSLTFPPGTTYYVRWDGGTPILHMPTAMTIDGPTTANGFVCYAAVTGNTSSNILCGIGRGPAGGAHSSIRFDTPTGTNLTYTWQPRNGNPQGQVYIAAVVPLNGGQPQFIPTMASGYPDTPTVATCYAVLNPDYSLYAQPACAVPNSAQQFSAARAAGIRGVGLPQR
jgi:hypothetical protein